MALSEKQKKTIKRLGVAFATYQEAIIEVETTGFNKRLANTVQVWANILGQCQTYLGVEHYNDAHLDKWTAKAREWETNNK